MSDKFTEAQRDISANRKEIIEKLVRFALTDACFSGRITMNCRGARKNCGCRLLFGRGSCCIQKL